MDKTYTNGIKEFLSLSIDDLKKMRSNSIAKRQIEEQKWKEVLRLLYNEHYLFPKGESLAYCPTYARIFYTDIQRHLKSNKPYTSQIIRDPNNALSPISDIVEELIEKRTGYYPEIDLGEYEQNIERLRKGIDRMIASNDVIADIFQTNYTEIKATGNSCIRREVTNLKTGEYRCYHVPLNEIAIEKRENINEPVYFFRDILMSFNDFKDYFPEEYSLKKCLSYYETLSQPENQFQKQIRIIENSYYCSETRQTAIRYYLEREEQSDLETEARFRNYQVFKYFQINATNSTYGKIDDKDYQIFLDLRNKQLFYKNMLDLRAKIEKPTVLNVVSLIQEKPLESNFQDGVNTSNVVREQNINNTKNITILPPQLIETFGGNLRNQNLEDPENIARYNNMEAMHFRNIEEFANNLNFDEAQKKVLIPMTERRDTTATEFKELLFASTVDKRQLEILESFTGDFYIFMIQFIVGYYAQKITEFALKTKGEIDDYIGLDYDELINEAFAKVLSLELNLSYEELKGNPFASFSQHPIVRQRKEEWQILLQNYKNVETDEERMIIEKEIIAFRDKYSNEIRTDLIYNLYEFKNKKSMEQQDDLADILVMSSSKEFILFILNFNKYSKKIKFSLASAEANILRNQDMQNYFKFSNIALDYSIKTGNPDIINETVIMLGLNKNLADIGIKNFNLGTDLIIGKQLDEAKASYKAEKLQEQIELAQGINQAKA